MLGSKAGTWTNRSNRSRPVLGKAFRTSLIQDAHQLDKLFNWWQTPTRDAVRVGVCYIAHSSG